MVAHDATTGEALGSVRENFFCCVVSYTIRDATGTPVYDVHPPTCLSGICVNCCDADSAGCMCFRAPFYIYPADGGEETRVGKLTKVWTGITKECCTLANTFEVDMPTGADGARASLVLGAGLLIDHVHASRARRDSNARAPARRSLGAASTVAAALAAPCSTLRRRTFSRAAAAQAPTRDPDVVGTGEKGRRPMAAR